MLLLAFFRALFCALVSAAGGIAAAGRVGGARLV
jgi:hypothetical protein